MNLFLLDHHQRSVEAGGTMNRLDRSRLMRWYKSVFGHRDAGPSPYLMQERIAPLFELGSGGGFIFRVPEIRSWQPLIRMK